MDMVSYLENFIGTPYHFGGNTKETGLDCSALILIGLRAFGHIGSRDMTAQMIYDHFKEYATNDNLTRRNDLLFFGVDIKNITHIAIAANNWQILEASGEGRTNTTDGFVRVMPMAHRHDFLATVRL